MSDVSTRQWVAAVGVAAWCAVCGVLAVIEFVYYIVEGHRG